MTKRKLFLGFLVVALVQLFIPAQMIWEREDIIKNGIALKFKTMPIDPNDPFRGKYIDLQFTANVFPIKAGEDWEPGEAVYVLLAHDSNGFAHIQDIQKQVPNADQLFVKAKVGHVMNSPEKQVHIDYPFTRCYMEESKAYEAEKLYRETLSDTTQPAYALVSVKQGKAVLQEVMIKGMPIRQLVLQRRAHDF